MNKINSDLLTRQLIDRNGWSLPPKQPKEKKTKKNNGDDNINSKTMIDAIDAAVEEDLQSQAQSPQFVLDMLQNYKLEDLKIFAKQRRLKITGKKQDLQYRLFGFYVLFPAAMKIQARVRGNYARKLMSLHGPAFKNRSLCVNTTDFYLLEELTNIPFHYFFSYRENNGFVYGFHIVSFYHLIKEQPSSALNPYTREHIDPNVIRDFYTLYIHLRQRECLKNSDSELPPLSVDAIASQQINLIQHQRRERLQQRLLETSRQTYDVRIRNILSNFDSGGHYSIARLVEIFCNLTSSQQIDYLVSLETIWRFRSGLSERVRSQLNILNQRIFYAEDLLRRLSENRQRSLMHYMLRSIEMIYWFTHGTRLAHVSEYFILGALTMISREAGDMLPVIREIYSDGIYNDMDDDYDDNEEN